VLPGHEVRLETFGISQVLFPARVILTPVAADVCVGPLNMAAFKTFRWSNEPTALSNASTMSKKTKSPTENSKRINQWQLGLLLILAGPLANSVLTTFEPLVPPLTNAQRGQAFGRGLASVVFVVAGVVLVVRHFVQRKREQGE